MWAVKGRNWLMKLMEISERTLKGGDWKLVRSEG